MKAAILAARRKITIDEVETPSPEAEEVLIRVKAVGICGSDIHGFEGLTLDRRPFGLIMGHEAAGQIVQIGKAVEHWKVGDRIVIDPFISCGKCYFCRRGWSHLCASKINIGSAMGGFRHGAMCEYIVMPARHVHDLPKDTNFVSGALVEPISCAVHVIERAKLESDSTIAIFGTGTIGLILVQIARLYSTRRIIAIDISKHRLSIAKYFGADVLINPERDDPIGIILSETDGLGVDVAIDAAGRVETYQNCIQAVRKRGNVMALGFSDTTIPFDMKSLIYREISIIGCTAYTHESRRSIELLNKGALRVQSIVTRQFPLEQTQRAFETAANPSEKNIKVMLIP